MKKMMLLAIMMIAGWMVNAQTPTNTDIENFFVGKWKLLVEGLPMGDTNMLLVIEKVDGKLQGTLGGENGEEMNAIEDVELDKNTLNFRFKGGGYDIPIYLDKNDDGTITGSMNDMFDITGEKLAGDKK